MRRYLLFIALSLAFFSGCSENAYVRGNQSIATLAIGGLAGQRAWKIADKGREDQIIAEVTHREDAQEGLSKWREISVRVDKGFDALVEALVAAKQALDAAEVAKGEFDVARWVVPVYHAAVAVKNILDVAGIRIVGLDTLLDAASKLVGKPDAAHLRAFRVAMVQFTGGL